MLPAGHKFGFVQRKPGVSSNAVKKLHLNEIDMDAAPILNDGKQNFAEKDQSKKRKADSELYSELYSSPKKTLLSQHTCDENNNNSNSFDTVDSKSCIVFRNWYPLLSIQGDIFIEGNVKCDILSRSFPIAKRLTNNKLQSIYKRIYILDGTLKDNGRVPKYIVKKFHNGFPEDWEIVCHFWNLYLNTRGKKKLSSFKWPEPMASSITSDEKNIDYNKSITNTKGYQVFSQWQVLINDKGQLIIEGTSEWGNIERSKPIIKRFSNKKVLCSSHEIYVLDGTLVNERNDLPDYVRWKFHNGFPLDWENVYRHWKNYLAKRVTAKRLL